MDWIMYHHAHIVRRNVFGRVCEWVVLTFHRDAYDFVRETIRGKADSIREAIDNAMREAPSVPSTSPALTSAMGVSLPEKGAAGAVGEQWTVERTTEHCWLAVGGKALAGKLPKEYSGILRLIGDARNTEVAALRQRLEKAETRLKFYNKAWTEACQRESELIAQYVLKEVPSAPKAEDQPK